MVSNWGAKHFEKQPKHPILTELERSIYSVQPTSEGLERVKIKLDSSDIKFIPARNGVINGFIKINRILKKFIRHPKKLVRQCLVILKVAQ